MTILVCPLSRVEEMIGVNEPERIVSLLDPEYTFPDAGPKYLDRHLQLKFHDIHVPVDGQIMPSVKHVEQLLAFLTAWKRTAPLLIHCRAGIGRSTATAYIAACLHSPSADELGIATMLRQVAPFARPNETLIRLADQAMSRHGRMSNAIAESGRDLPEIDASEGEPFEMPLSYRVSSARVQQGRGLC